MRYLPVIVAIVVMLGVACVLVVFVVRSDRKRRFRDGDVSLDWVQKPGRCTTSVLVDASLSLDAAIAVAQSAVQSCGGADLQLVDGVGVVGWNDVKPVVGWFGWAPQELAVVVAPIDGSTVRYWCCSRPRIRDCPFRHGA